MIKTILFVLLKILGVLVILFLFGVAYFFYQYRVQKGGYGIGWKNVYFYTKYKVKRDKDQVVGADAKTFEVLDTYGYYAKDKHRVYYKFHPLAESDPNSFSTDHFLGIKLLHRGQQNVYLEDQLISRDADHFEAINSYYYKDSQHIYRARYAHMDIDLKGFDVVEGIDQTTFQALDFPYCRDKDHVFFKEYKLHGLNPDQVKLIIDESGFYYFAMDDKQVYFYEDILPDADPATLTLVEGSWWKDKNQVYYRGKVLPNANPNTFESLKGRSGNAYFYSKDDKHVYHKSIKLEGLNPATIQELENGNWTDGVVTLDGSGARLN